ncbi:hypothetical protein B0H16DRAFT_1900943 [Mycena metata]|uniref:Uncharacterized protein n=1 Tax=Mycena metata TaxID=1033252 RepID=A0AAD7H1I3_9AGAR|nr:hypothetical protein B0H16DRAFT_1900943 [Mycena metata]
MSDYRTSHDSDHQNHNAKDPPFCLYHGASQEAAVLHTLDRSPSGLVRRVSSPIGPRAWPATAILDILLPVDVDLGPAQHQTASKDLLTAFPEGFVQIICLDAAQDSVLRRSFACRRQCGRKCKPAEADLYNRAKESILYVPCDKLGGVFAPNALRMGDQGVCTFLTMSKYIDGRSAPKLRRYIHQLTQVPSHPYPVENAFTARDSVLYGNHNYTVLRDARRDKIVLTMQVHTSHGPGLARPVLTGCY